MLRIVISDTLDIDSFTFSQNRVPSAPTAEWMVHREAETCGASWGLRLCFEGKHIFVGKLRSWLHLTEPERKKLPKRNMAVEEQTPLSFLFPAPE